MLIVIVIIGILSASVLPRVLGIQENARDTARKADISSLQTALELYHIDSGSYPRSDTAAWCAAYAPLGYGWCNSSQVNTDGRWMVNWNLASYLIKDPIDPKFATAKPDNKDWWKYYYYSTQTDLWWCKGHQYYLIVSGMERSKNKNWNAAKVCNWFILSPSAPWSYALVHDNKKGTITK